MFYLLRFFIGRIRAKIHSILYLHNIEFHHYRKDIDTASRVYLINCMYCPISFYINHKLAKIVKAEEEAAIMKQKEGKNERDTRSNYKRIPPNSIQ